ncbi:TlpA family protein disulfide reductase [Chitinophaga horti]|uniref:TlpA family protein disulfide reductase n=1 Tax=Chitinophaga horti TaxID=2920382 RepID=A0ABY6IXJ5_9BACT|nr:TlpA disulfide reductase family protein [Chitinophaga horti]UYQ92103.1 TlpA family protein disulfide reductase [Chitinophaga horti]
MNIQRLLLGALLALTLPTYAQQAPKQFVLKGHATNFKSDFFEAGLSGMFDFSIKGIPVDGKGNFSVTYPLHEIQDFAFILDDSMFRTFVEPGDTLTLTWDDTRINASMVLKANRPYRQQEIDLMQQLNNSLYAYRDAIQGLYKNDVRDSAAAAVINAQYNKDLKIIAAAPLTRNSKKFFVDKYYQYLEPLKSRASLQKFRLEASPELLANEQLVRYILRPDAYQFPDEYALMHSSEYRGFLDNYIRFEYAMKNGGAYNDDRYKSPGFIPFNPIARNYHNAMAAFDVLSIRDWAVTKILMGAYMHEPFDKVDVVYQQFLKEALVPAYRDSLVAFRTKMLKLKPGAKAPVFTLKDDKGKAVSLSDFKGKLVYVDFWGVYCGPCIADIESSAVKIHERYKEKPVVFLTICIDAKPDKWKETLAKYKLDGVNLFAPDGVRTPVVTTYGIAGIPHYLLIDENGIILDNNAPRYSELLRDNNNMLDQALSKKKPRTN